MKPALNTIGDFYYLRANCARFLIVKFTVINKRRKKIVYIIFLPDSDDGSTHGITRTGTIRARPRGFVRISVNLYSTHSLTHPRLSNSSIMFRSYRAYHDWHHIVHYARLACDCIALN